MKTIEELKEYLKEEIKSNSQKGCFGCFGCRPSLSDYYNYDEVRSEVLQELLEEIEDM